MMSQRALQQMLLYVRHQSLFGAETLLAEVAVVVDALLQLAERPHALVDILCGVRLKPEFVKGI